MAEKQELAQQGDFHPSFDELCDEYKVLYLNARNAVNSKGEEQSA